MPVMPDKVSAKKLFCVINSRIFPNGTKMIGYHSNVFFGLELGLSLSSLYGRAPAKVRRVPVEHPGWN